MLSFYGHRQLRKLVSCSKWFLLFFSLLMVMVMVFFIVGRTKETETVSSVTSSIPEEVPSAANEEVQVPELEYVRKNHLFKYDPSAPTNYSGGHEGWLQRLSKTVAERLNFKVGQCHVTKLSNSLLLEQSYGWTGLLIEADPVSVKTLKWRNRQAWMADVCLSPKPHPMMIEMAGHDTWPEISPWLC